MATAPPTVSVLLQSLRRLRSNARDGTLHEQFFVNGYRYFVEGQARCWWCRHETQEAAAEMLHLFALQPNDNTENYKRALAARLAECDRCVTVYYSAKAALKRRYEDLYDKATVDSVFRAIEAWDVQRIVRRFASSSNERSAVIDALAGTANLLAHREMEDMVCAYVESCQAAGRLLAATVDGSGLLPGVLLLCFSANQRVRGWARQMIKHGAAKDHAAPWEPVLAVLTCVFGAPAAGAAPTTFRFSRNSLWHGLRALFVRLAPDAKRSLVEQLGPLAGPLCRAVLAAEGAEFVDALRVFSDIIGAREAPSVWPAIAQSAKLTPIDFARAVLGRSDVRRLLEVGGDGDFGDSALESCSRRLRPVLGWITPFTGSLDLPGDADALGVLLEELVLVIGTNTRLPAAARALGLHTGVAIIRHCFKLPPGKTLVVESGCFVLDSFLNRHIGMLVDVAQGRGDLSESDLLITGTEDLVDTMVRDDLTWTLKAVSEYGEAALEARACEGVDAGLNHAPPVLLHFPALWQSLLKDLNNTNVLRRALFGASYLLLFDALPDSLSIWLQPAWRDACKRFERLRADMRSHLQRALELLADGLDSVDAASRRGFELEILPSQLRILVSPAGSVHAAVLRVLRVGPLDGQDEPDIGEAAVGKAPTELTDCERDMACNELFERYQEVFVDGLARIVHDCTVLVKYRRPAQSCCRNTALLVRSLLSIVGGSSPERVLEPLARLFYGLCGLLGSILRESIEANVDKAGSSSGYEGAILTVFRTVYDMLNSAEFVDYVRMAKSSAVVDEDEALDALSTCVSQMFKYLERESDVMGVSERIVRTFGMVASGLAATPGASILYPAKAMGALASGETGCVAATHRPLLRSVLDMPVWQARHVAISERKPLQISIDEVEAFAAMDNLDLTDILDDVAAADVVAIASRPEPNVIIVDSDDRPPRDVVARAAPKAEGSSHPEQPMLAPVPVVEIDGSDDDDEMTEEVTEIQLTPADAQNARRKQSSMDYWFAAVSTRPAISRPAAAAQAASKPRPKPKPTSGVLGQMRASFAQERRAVLPSRTQLPTIPKQVVKPARALPSVPVETWAARRFDTPLEPPRPAVHIPVRDASRAAIDERRARDIARGKSGTPHASREVSSSDNDDDDDGGGGLAGLIEISRPRDPQAPRRRAIRIAPHASGAGAHLGGGVPTAMQLTRERAAAEERARMRLLPSMAALHKHLLSWRYEDAGDVPPGMEALAAEARVPDRFDDSGRYLAAFEPLLLLECWAQFQRAKEEMTGDDMCEAHLRAHMSESEFRVLTFAVTAADARLLSESDVLVFSEAQSHEKQLAQRSRGGVSDQSSFLAVVHKRQFARDTAQVIVRVHFEGVRLAHQLTRLVLNSAWTFFRLLSLTTVHREFAALRSLPYLDEELVAAILRPRPGLTRALKCAEVRECMQAHALNQPQAEAVVAALRCESGFTLIQGPPGTGKTKTILGLIGALLSAARAGDAATGGAGRLLVCAPSNAAVDEIVRRLMAGIRDSTGGTYQPRVVRVGQLSSVSSTVRESTLDAQLEQALDKQRKSSSDTAKSGEALQTLRKQLDSVNTEIRELDNQLQSIDPVDTAALQAIREQFRSAKGRKRTVCQQLELERARTRDEARAADETRTRLRRQILLGAEVVCTTLSGSGHEALASLGCEYGTVIIDEAAQSVELACLIPLKYECKRCIL
ncbi:DEAD-box type RNA helicase, partial [Coemansia spiralis]